MNKDHEGEGCLLTCQAAWNERHKMLVVPPTLQRHTLRDSDKAVVTLGDPDAAAKAEIAKAL